MRSPQIIRRALVVLVAAAGVAACLATAVALDWPQWRGPLRNGLSEETGLLKEWPAGGPKQLWQVDNIGTGYSTPVVKGNRIYILGNNGMDNEFVQALNVADGSQVWSQKIGKVGNPDQNPPYPGARSTPTLDGDRMFVLGSDGDLACLEVATGKPVWQKNVRTEFGGKPGEWAYSESPLVDGDVVICTPGGKEATMLAVNKTTGDVVWKAPLAEADDASYASALVATIGGVKQYVQFLQKGLVGVDAATGKELWRYGRTAEGSQANIPTPVVFGDYVYSAAGRIGGGLIRVEAKDGVFTPNEVYFESRLPKGIGGSVLLGDYMYGTSEAMVCVEFLTGAEKWRNKSVGAASVCYADGNLYLHGENGEVALVEATPEKYVEKGRFTPANPPDHGKTKTWAYPVVADGRLYIFDFGTLWCYDVKASAN